MSSQSSGEGTTLFDFGDDTDGADETAEAEESEPDLEPIEFTFTYAEGPLNHNSPGSQGLRENTKFDRGGEGHNGTASERPFYADGRSGPSVPENIDWEDYKAYRCENCSSNCLNRRDTKPGRTDHCWSCSKVLEL